MLKIISIIKNFSQSRERCALYSTIKNKNYLCLLQLHYRNINFLKIDYVIFLNLNKFLEFSKILEVQFFVKF